MLASSQNQQQTSDGLAFLASPLGLLIADVRWSVGRRLVELFTCEPSQGFVGGVAFVNAGRSLPLAEALQAAGYAGAVTGFREAHLAFYGTGGNCYVQTLGADADGLSLFTSPGLFGGDPAKALRLRQGSNVVLAIRENSLVVSALAPSLEGYVQRTFAASATGAGGLWSTQLSDRVWVYEDGVRTELNIPTSLRITQGETHGPLCDFSSTGLQTNLPISAQSGIKGSSFEVTNTTVGYVTTPRINLTGGGLVTMAAGSLTLGAAAAPVTITSTGAGSFPSSVTAASFTTTGGVTCGGFSCGDFSLAQTSTNTELRAAQKGFLFITSAGGTQPAQVLKLTATAAEMQLGILRNSAGAAVLTVAPGDIKATFAGAVEGVLTSRGFLGVAPSPTNFTIAQLQSSANQGSQLFLGGGGTDAWIFECASSKQFTLWRNVPDAQNPANSVLTAALRIDFSTNNVSIPQQLSVGSLLINGSAPAPASALAGYLPLTGGTLTGQLNGTGAVFTNPVSTGMLTVNSSKALVTATLSGGGIVSCDVTNSGTNGFAALYLYALNETAQLYVGQGGGLSVRTRTNHPIVFSVNDTREVLRLATDLSATFAGGVAAASANLMGALTAASATLSASLTAASVQLTGAVRALSANITGAVSAGSLAVSGSSVFGGNARFAGQNVVTPVVAGCQLGLDSASNAGLELTSAGTVSYVDFGPANTDFRTRIMCTLAASTLTCYAAGGTFTDNPLTIVSCTAAAADLAFPADINGSTVLTFDAVAGRGPFYSGLNHTFTIPVTGFYAVQIHWACSAANGRDPALFDTLLTSGGTTVRAACGFSLCCTLLLTQGALVQFRARNRSGNAETIWRTAGGGMMGAAIQPTHGSIGLTHHAP